MRTVKTKVYKFEELSEEAQEKALNELADINVDYDWWDIDGLLDLTKDEMSEAGIEPGEIKGVLFSYTVREFDLERGQYLQLDGVLVNNDEAFRKFLKIPKDLWNQCSYYFENDSRNCNTCLEFRTNKMPTIEDESFLADAEEIMTNKIHEAWVSLRDDYEYLTSEEAIKDTIEANEYEFYESGKMF